MGRTRREARRTSGAVESITQPTVCRRGQPFTLIVVAFERPQKLHKLLESFFRHHPHCYCIVSDVSRNPVDVSFSHPNLRILRCSETANLSAGRNRALAKVTTPHFALMDDDEWIETPDALNRLHSHVSSGRCQVAAGDVIEDGKSLTFTGNFRLERGGLRVDPTETDGNERIVDCAPNFFVADTAAVRMVDPWKEEYPVCEHLNFALWCKIGNLVTLYDPKSYCQHKRGGEEQGYSQFRKRQGLELQFLEQWRLDFLQHANGRVINRDVLSGKGQKIPESSDACCVWVIGTGRCGSSAVGQILHNLGVSMGDDLADTSQDEKHKNPDGYFEPLGLINIQGRLKFGRDLSNCKTQIAAHMRRMAARHKMFGFKLPGTAHRPELVLEAMRSAKVTPRFVHVTRSVEESAASVVAAGWQPNMQKAIEHMRQRDDTVRAFLESQRGIFCLPFRDLLRSPLSITKSLADWLGIKDEKLIEKAASTVRREYVTQGAG